MRCNQFIKFDALLVKAASLARLRRDRPLRPDRARTVPRRHRLRKAADPSKDQSYVLYVMTQDRLARRCCRSVS